MFFSNTNRVRLHRMQVLPRQLIHTLPFKAQLFLWPTIPREFLAWSWKQTNSNLNYSSFQFQSICRSRWHILRSRWNFVNSSVCFIEQGSTTDTNTEQFHCHSTTTFEKVWADSSGASVTSSDGESWQRWKFGVQNSRSWTRVARSVPSNDRHERHDSSCDCLPWNYSRLLQVSANFVF